MEGPRPIVAALAHGAPLHTVYLGADAPETLRAVAAEAAAAGVPVRVLDGATAERVASTTTPQPLYALAPLVRCGAEALTGANLVLVGAQIADPGNAGTLVRSAAGAGARVVVLGERSVDAYNPKVVRASAGACFAVRIVEGVPLVDILAALGEAGVQRVAAVAAGGQPPEAVDLRPPTAIVVGHETRGLPASLPADRHVTVPLAEGESLNVAVAGSVLLFETARQRREAT